jgi:tetratricopeptide (TPR) repeat protein
VTEARAELKAGRTEAATQRLLQCANRTPASARCDGELGLLFAKQLKRRSEALYYLRSAVEAEPNDAEAELLQRIARQLAALRELDLALQSIDRAIAIAPNDPALLAAKSRVLQTDPKRRAEAADQLAAARERDDRDAWLREEAVLRGQVADQLDQARTLFETLAKRKKDDPATVARIEKRIEALEIQLQARAAAAKHKAESATPDR